MNAKEFVEQLSSRGEAKYTRTYLADMTIDEEATITPSHPSYRTGSYTDNGASILIKSIHCYSDDDCLFSDECFGLQGVVRTGAGHLFLDRFEYDKERTPCES